MAKNKLKQASERTVGRKAADWANPFVTPSTKFANAVTFLAGQNGQKKKEEAERNAIIAKRKEAEAYNAKIDSQENSRKQAEFLKAIMSQATDYRQQAPYLEEYFNLIQNEYPGRGQRLQELDAYGNGQGANEMNQMLGLDDPETGALNQLNASRFMEDFGQPTGDEESDLRNAELIARIMDQPELASQYYGKQNNPNIIDQVGGRLESILPGPKNTYEEIMKRKRLSGMGENFTSYSTPGYRM